MFHPLSIYVGLRYVRARSHKFFVSFITWASLAGVCVGVAALIVILSVMNGFESELRESLLSLSAHARVVARTGTTSAPTTSEWRHAEQAIRGVSGVAGVAPYIEIQALAVHTPEMLPVVLRGIDPKLEGSVTQISGSITHGHLEDLRPGSGNVLAGAVVGERLGLTLGDSLTLLIPTVGADGTPVPKLRELTMAGLFEAGSPEPDSTLVLMNIEDVRALGSAGVSGAGLRVLFQDALAAPELADTLRKLVPPSLEVIDWTQDHASYFRAIRIEKTMMSLILLLIVAVAAFNLVAMLVMVVTDKRTDIAILRTFGASPRRVLGVFITQGLVIGWLGVALGIVLGLAIAFNVSSIVPVLQSAFGFQIMDPDVYYNTAIPSEVHPGNVAIIGAAALLMTALATIYPAVRAARTPPAESLRYE
jgi:lipoprotein-releasing system permease protein